LLVVSSAIGMMPTHANSKALTVIDKEVNSVPYDVETLEKLVE